MVEISRLFWKNVYTSDSVLLGEVQSFEVNMKTWDVTNLYVGLSDDEATLALGFNRPWLGRVVVCLPVSVVDLFKDAAMLNKTMQELSELKECKL